VHRRRLRSPDAPERRYALPEIKQQLPKWWLSERPVLIAYGGRCAISRLPEPKLLDAAHIIDDANERLGQLVVTNGLPSSKIHHAACDAQLTGVDPDFRIHVSDRRLDLHDGPFLEQGSKARRLWPGYSSVCPSERTITQTGSGSPSGLSSSGNPLSCRDEVSPRPADDARERGCCTRSSRVSGRAQLCRRDRA
jgi:hypothetical protein